MVFCDNCGIEIPEGASFCPVCGNAVPEEREVTEKEKNSVFGKGIAAVILAGYPIISIAAIILGVITNRQYIAICKTGVPVGGRLKTGGILSRVGLVVGIIMTATIASVIGLLLLKSAGINLNS